MTTLSVPLPADLLQALEELVRTGKVQNKAAAMRDALKFYLQDQAVQAVLSAQAEPTLRGDLDTLAQAL